MSVLFFYDVKVRIKFGGLPTLRDIYFFENEG